MRKKRTKKKERIIVDFMMVMNHFSILTFFVLCFRTHSRVVLSLSVSLIDFTEFGIM